jgi:hypothetical protein
LQTEHNSNIKVLTLNIPDCEEPDIIAALKLEEWFNTEQGQWCKVNSNKITGTISSAPAYYIEYQVWAEFSAANKLIYYLKYGV